MHKLLKSQILATPELDIYARLTENQLVNGSIRRTDCSSPKALR